MLSKRPAPRGPLAAAAQCSGLAVGVGLLIASPLPGIHASRDVLKPRNWPSGVCVSPALAPGRVSAAPEGAAGGRRASQGPAPQQQHLLPIAQTIRGRQRLPGAERAQRDEELQERRWLWSKESCSMGKRPLQPGFVRGVSFSFLPSLSLFFFWPELIKPA